jgi:hypothetical protein
MSGKSDAWKFEMALILSCPGLLSLVSPGGSFTGLSRKEGAAHAVPAPTPDEAA